MQTSYTQTAEDRVKEGNGDGKEDKSEQPEIEPSGKKGKSSTDEE